MYSQIKHYKLSFPNMKLTFIMFVCQEEYSFYVTISVILAIIPISLYYFDLK